MIHFLESSDSDDHFSDAQSGLEPPSGVASPIPHTRVEKVDDEPRYGEDPETEAYHMREQDAVPDEIEVVPEGKHSRTTSPLGTGTSTPGGQPIPMTVVEKIDPEVPTYGEVPGTEAHEKRLADAVPDLVVRSGSRSRASTMTRSRAGSTPGDLPIPITKVERVDSMPRHGEIPGTKAYELRKEDAKPDLVEEVGDVAGKGISASRASERLTESGSPTSPAPRFPTVIHARRKSSAAGRKGDTAATDDYNEAEDGSDGGFGDDFDDFEEGEEDAEFGDFDDGFQEAAPAPPPPQSIPVVPAFVSSKSKDLHHMLHPLCLLRTNTLPASSRLFRSRFTRRDPSSNRPIYGRSLPI